jgi:hypothetical protein
MRRTSEQDLLKGIPELALTYSEVGAFEYRRTILDRLQPGR